MPDLKMAAQTAMQAAAQRKMGTQKKFKGKYAGPDKYKGQIPAHLKSKYKGKYFGKESNKGGNPTVSSVPKTAPSSESQMHTQVMPEGWRNDPKYANPIKKRPKTPEERASGKARFDAQKAVVDKLRAAQATG